MALARETGKGGQRQGLQKNEKLNSSRLLSLCVPKCWTNQLHVPVCVRVCVCEGFALGFARQEYWSGLPFLSPGDLSDPGIEPGLLHCRQIPYHLSHQESPNDVIMP